MSIGGELSMQIVGPIVTPCPTCGNKTLIIGKGGHLTCSWLQCREPSVEAAINVLLAQREELGRLNAKCLDCGKPYADFGLDLLLPRSQWLAIHPDDHGLLCAGCILARASKIPGTTGVHGVIEIKARKLGEIVQ